MDEEKGKYSYDAKSKCPAISPTATMAGKFSEDPEWPGDLKENLAIFGVPIAPLVPNMMWHVVRDFKAKGNPIRYAYTYACLGKVPAVVGPELFSFNLITRSTDYS